MNPFGLSGPSFLAFYAVFCTVLWLAQYFMLRALEEGPPHKISALDPYSWAYLRAGRSEALFVTAVSLLSRGLLQERERLLVAQAGAPEIARRPLERDMLEYFATPARADSIFDNEALGQVADGIGRDLEQRGLLPTDAQRLSRGVLMGAVLMVLLGVAGIKISVALARGRHNIGFLIMLAALGAFFVVKTGLSSRTIAGDRALAEMRALGKALKDRADAFSSGKYEVALLAGIFNFNELPYAYQLELSPLFPRQAGKSGGEGSSQSDSSGCGSDSSCGSSCGGGGGCGGGCGGCGS